MYVGLLVTSSASKDRGERNLHLFAKHGKLYGLPYTRCGQHKTQWQSSFVAQGRSSMATLSTWRSQCRNHSCRPRNPHNSHNSMFCKGHQHTGLLPGRIQGPALLLRTPRKPGHKYRRTRAP